MVFENLGNIILSQFSEEKNVHNLTCFSYLPGPFSSYHFSFFICLECLAVFFLFEGIRQEKKEVGENVAKVKFKLQEEFF